MDCYIYYRVDAARTVDVEARVRALLQGMAPYTATPALWQRKVDEPLTWMEIYPQVSDRPGFSQRMAQLLRELTWDDGASARREEWFEPVDPPRQGQD